MKQKLAKILVIDDNEDFVDSLVSVLREEGFRVKGVSTPSTMRNAARHEDYDIVLLDIVIPGLDVPRYMGGRRILVDIMTYHPEAKVVLLSGEATGEQIVDCLRCGAIDFVQKPVNLEEHRVLKDRILARLEGPNLVHDKNALRETLVRLLWKGLQQGSPIDRGLYLQELVYHLFASVTGFTRIRLGVVRKPDEIDLEVTNERPDPFWIRRGDLILVECKNLSKKRRAPTGALDVLERRVGRWKGHCKLAFFVSVSGFSKGFIAVLKNETSRSFEIACIDFKRLETLVHCSPTQRSDELRKFVENPIPEST